MTAITGNPKQIENDIDVKKVEKKKEGEQMTNYATKDELQKEHKETTRIMVGIVLGMFGTVAAFAIIINISLNPKFDAMTQSIATLNQNVSSMNQRIDRIESSFNQKMDRIENSQYDLRKEISNNHNQILDKLK